MVTDVIPDQAAAASASLWIAAGDPLLRRIKTPVIEFPVSALPSSFLIGQVLMFIGGVALLPGYTARFNIVCARMFAAADAQTIRRGLAGIRRGLAGIRSGFIPGAMTMGFEYGSQTIEIRNPFRIEGAAYAFRGILVVAMGVYLMLQVKDRVSAGEETLAQLQFGGGALLVAFGLLALGVGAFKMFRFYVGRGVPANLASQSADAATIAPGSAGSFRHGGVYDDRMLSQMLLGRKNLTFIEPHGWLARLLHSMLFPLIFVPHPMRAITRKVFTAAWYTVVLLLLLGLALFSGTTGLTDITDTPVADWLAALALLLILAVWVRNWPTRSDLRNPQLSSSDYTPGAAFGSQFGFFMRQALKLGAAILTPAALLWAHAEYGLEPIPFSPYPWLAAVVVFSVLAVSYALLLAHRRAPRDTVPTDVSEYRTHWQESVHPMDIFRAAEMTLANHRYLEIPNRVYALKDPELERQGSENKGDFSGETLQEIQPEPLPDQRRDPLVLPGILLGQALLLGAAAWLFVVLLGDVAPTNEVIAGAVLGPVILGLFGHVVAATSNLYLAEIRFQSQLIAFMASGTYAESRLATGMSIYDSTRSENVIVRSSLTPWLIVSRLHTSIIAVSGSLNLEQPRYVLEMHKNDALRDELIEDIRTYMRERQVMAGVSSAADLDAASTIHQMNERTRATQPRLDSHAPMSEEVRNERLGHERED